MNASATSSLGAKPPEFLARVEPGVRRALPRPWHRGYAVLRGLYRAVEDLSRHVDGGGGAGGGTLLDFGCGDMPYEGLLRPRVQQYVGIDLPGNPRAQFTLKADGTTDAPDASADVVLSTQVLEHVVSPEVYLGECRRMLKPGGLLLLSTHGHWKYHPDPVDLHRWTGPGLRGLLSQQGFGVVEIRGVLGLAAAGLQLFQDGLLSRTPRKLRPLVSLPLQQCIRLADLLHNDRHRANDAAVFVVAARKSP